MQLSTIWRVGRDRGFQNLPALGLNYLTYYFNRNLAKKRFFERAINDYRMIVDLKDRGLSRELWIFGTRELEHIWILRQILKPGMTILDLGANIGYYTIMMARFVGAQGTVYAIEPTPTSYKLLNVNIVLNQLEEVVRPFHMAVSNDVGVGTLYMGELANQNSFYPYTHSDVAVSVSPESPSVQVETTTLPAFATGKKHIDLVRMDIEGYEVEVFQGAVSWLRQNGVSPRFLFETHPHAYCAVTHDMSGSLRSLFECGYYARYIASDLHNSGGREVFEHYGYTPLCVLPTDSTQRGIYENVSNSHAITLICDTKFVRTVLLERKL